MSWVMKRVARCDECGFEWIPTSESPSQCPSRKCRKRTWNKLEGRKQFEDYTTESAVTVEDAKELLPVITAKPVEGLPGVRKGKKSAAVQEPVVEPENAMDEDIEAMMPEMCPYTEYNTDTGETYACALEVHGPKIRHKMGAKVG